MIGSSSLVLATSKRASDASSRRTSCAWRRRARLGDVEGASARLELATMAARMGCDLLESVRDEVVLSGRTKRKSDASPVTMADYGAQALISLLLSRDQDEKNADLWAEEGSQYLLQDVSFVEEITKIVDEVLLLHGMNGTCREEVIESLKRSDATRLSTERKGKAFDGWILDPIDGTRGYLRGGTCEYALGLAYVKDGRLDVGAMGLPNTSLPASKSNHKGLILRSSRGGGTQWNAWNRFQDVGTRVDEGSWKECRVDVSSTCNESVLCVSEDARSGEYSRFFSREKRICCGSLCKYASVATGNSTAYYQAVLPTRSHWMVWDHVSGILCVEEAGGKVTDLNGSSLESFEGISFVPGGRGILVTNGILHDDLLERFRGLDDEAPARTS